MKLRLVLGDQLNTQITALTDIDPEQDVVMLCEVMEEARYVQHHQKKLVFVFACMRHFAQHLQSLGYTVRYIQLDDADNTGSFTKELTRAISALAPSAVVCTEASEYRVLQMQKNWQRDYSVPVEIRPDKRFLSSHKGFNQWADGRKQWRMEYFYRQIRKTYGILMDGDQPAGGQWNFDQDNRKTPPADLAIPKTYQQASDEITQAVMQLVKTTFTDNIGSVDDFHYAVTREQALDALEQFIQTRLPLFGDYQDAMLAAEPWLFHSHISLYLNIGLLLPMECIQAAQVAYDRGKAPINAVEGFIRQIAGWREYVRGVYWHTMPNYAKENHLDAQRALPAMYWGEETKMHCMQQCVQDTIDHGYAHHIQRLMVLGNFALLTGLSPAAVNDWYLLVYADAYEWVELPNVSGMVLFADGGKLGSKPYAASGSYINKMSDYCQSCHYQVKQKNGEAACPFNYLYWAFLMQHQAKLAANPRMAMPYRTLSKMTDEKKQTIVADSVRFLNRMDAGEKV